VIASRYRI